MLIKRLGAGRYLGTVLYVQNIPGMQIHRIYAI